MVVWLLAALTAAALPAATAATAARGAKPVIKAVEVGCKTAGYSARFKTRPLKIGDPVTFTAVARAPAGRAKVKVTQGLLCLHDNGSTPQH